MVALLVLVEGLAGNLEAVVVSVALPGSGEVSLGEPLAQGVVALVPAALAKAVVLAVAALVGAATAGEGMVAVGEVVAVMVVVALEAVPRVGSEVVEADAMALPPG